MSEARKQQLVVFGLLLTTIPFFFIVDMPTSWTSLKALALYLSTVAGYIGLAFLTWSFVLGTRSVSGLFFSDLPSKLKLHRQLGTYGIIVFVLHAILVVIALSLPLTYLITPELDGLGYERAVTFGRFALYGLLLIWFTSAIVSKAINYRPWKYIHYIAYPVLFLSLLHIPATGTSFSNRAVLFYWSVFVSIILLCVALRMRHLFGFGKVVYEIEKNKALTEDVQLLRLRATNKAIDIHAGQYIYLQPSLLSEEHPFTVLDYDNDTGQLLIAFKKYGRFTERLADMQTGEILLVDGPYGTFTREHQNQVQPHSVFLAGGIGITPFIKHAIEDDANTYFMFYANRTHHTAVLRDNLRSKLGDRYIDVFSRETGLKEIESNVEQGHISADIISQYVPSPDTRHYYICGPQGFIETAKEQLASIGVPKTQVHAEEFSF